MKKLLPIIVVVIALVAGVGGGKLLQPAPPIDEEKLSEDCSNGDEEGCADIPRPVLVVEPEELYDPEQSSEFAKIPKQFVIPIVKNERVRALVVMSITLEVETGSTDQIFEREPKLRDGFLRVMFEHANTGGFDGAFTTGESMRDLRGALKEAARRSAGEIVQDVLITELVKQAI